MRRAITLKAEGVPLISCLTSEQALGIGPLFKGWLLLSPPTASKMDAPMGLEPTTSPFGGERSQSRLSYGAKFINLFGAGFAAFA